MAGRAAGRTLCVGGEEGLEGHRAKTQLTHRPQEADREMEGGVGGSKKILVWLVSFISLQAELIRVLQLKVTFIPGWCGSVG